MWTIGTLYWLFSEKKDNMKVFLFLLLLRLISATKGQGQNMRVRISAFGDTITFKFLQPRVNSRLEGYILGYGSSMFSKQLIQLPEDEQPFETERDAEPKYLIAVRSANDDEPVRKQCAGKVDLEKPLHIVIGSVTDSSVLLSWGTLLTTPFTDSIVEDCVEDGHFTVRYREKEPSNNWNYQTCPTTSTVIDHLKPDALYEFEVRADTETKSGDWSPPIIHNTADQIIDEPFKELNQARTKQKPDQPLSFPAVPVLKNITQVKPAPLIRQIVPPDPLITSEAEEVTTALISAEDLIPSTQPPAFPQAPILLPTTKTTSTVQHKKSTSQPSTTKSVPDKSVTPQQPLTTRQPSFIQPQTSTFHSTTHSQTNTQVSTEDQYTTKQQLITVQQQLSKTTSNPIPTQTNAPPPQSTVQEHPTPPKEQDTITPDNRHTGEIQPSTKLQRLSPVPRPRGTGVFRNSSSVSRPLVRNVTNRLRPNGRVSLPTNTSMHQNPTLNRKRVPSGERIIGLQGTKPRKEPRKNRGKTKTNQVSESKEKENVINLKQMEPVPLKPLAPPTTERPAYQETPLKPLQLTLNGSRFDTGDNSSVFSPHPVSEIDAMGRKRFIAPHVIYKIDKRPEEPCSVTHSLSYFPDEEVGYSNVTGPPKTPPSNVTVVTVEGCPSFVIIDWEKTDNETKEYDVESTTKGPHGKEVSIVTTNQTHTAVENLKPESSYEFKVTPKNELGSGPASDPVTFSTESADPRVSEIPTGKNAIWSSFPFKADSYSECKGRQYIKRTWYRKFVGIQLCNSLRYNIYLSDSLKGKFYSIGDLAGNGEDHCQFVDSFLDGRTGGPLAPDQLPPRQGFFRAVRQEPVQFGEIGGNSLIKYVAWYECGIPIPGKW
ncbi:target of Nesh-SH3 isoform X5 [Triplophysa dalaica]|uniref:target of Nesh-SH3 isoform X5 n=1 Tax=Triplophysa dalaica TaxID=1582913 RepID=UPI0024DFC5D6|nr:target of Nesh-SH3 isoform X5 [Triplophysa dalaica]